MMAFVMMIIPWDKILPIIKDILRDIINRYIREKEKIKEDLKRFVWSLFAGDPSLEFLAPLIYSCFSSLCDEFAEVFKGHSFRTSQVVFLRVSWLFERFYGDTIADAVWSLAEMRNIDIPSKYELGFDLTFSTCWDILSSYLDSQNEMFKTKYKLTIDMGGALIGSILHIMGISRIKIQLGDRMIIINASDLWVLLPLLYYYIISSIETEKSIPDQLVEFWLSFAPNFKEHLDIMVGEISNLFPDYYSQKTLKMFKEFGEYIYQYAEKLRKK